MSHLSFWPILLYSAKEFGDSPKITTFLESCGVADLITTCYGGRNSRLSKEFVIQKKSISTLENELLNGQKLQGNFTISTKICELA